MIYKRAWYVVTGEHHPRSWHNGNYWKSAGHIRFHVMCTMEKVIKYLEPKMLEEDEEMRTARKADYLKYEELKCRAKFMTTAAGWIYDERRRLRRKCS